MFPGSELVHLADPANGAMDIAENILDLQVALGIDLDLDGVVDEREDDGTPLPPEDDEWQGNHADDAADPLAWSLAPLHFIRLTTLGHTRGPDRQYVAPPITRLENHDYAEVAPRTPEEAATRRFRRRQLTNVIDVRNL
jgi:hypothetical protein